jgi:hypothetical protein
VFHFDQRYYIAGDLATGHVTYSLHGTGSGRWRDRPYYAYLVPGGGWIRPPHIPIDAILVGQVRMHRLTSSAWLTRASLTFPVPAVAPGAYDVALCNRPCRDTIVGDLAGGWITVVGSRAEARLRTVQDNAEARQARALNRLEGRMRGLERQHAHDQREAQAQIASLKARVGALSERLSQAGSRLGAAGQRDRRESATPIGLLGWILVCALGLLTVVLLLLARTRRDQSSPRLRDGSVHPDFDRVGR